MDENAIVGRLSELEEEIAGLREALHAPRNPREWQPEGFYLIYHMTAGAILGFCAAGSSLLFNIVGSLLVGQDPLRLIRIYLTFPLGDAALSTGSGAALAVGVFLYLMTGAILGVPFHVILNRYFAHSSFASRFQAASLIGLGIWLVNFYGILSWLQPLLFGGRWIIAMIPFWVAALTHLVFVWTMLLIGRWGKFDRGSYAA
jgi:hypothetical protein